METITHPSAPVADATSAEIIAHAPPAPDLNPSTGSGPAASPTAAGPKTTTATVNAATGVIYQGQVYAKGSTITAPRKALKKFAKAVTIAKPTNSTAQKSKVVAK
jgi:hypothetical protein